jgi:hypothetical protein
VSIDSIKKLFEFLINKEQGLSLSGAEFNILFRQSEYNYLTFLIGKEEQFTNGRPTPRVGLGLSQGVLAKIQPFIKATTPTVTSGQVSVPSDFLAMLAMRTTANVEIRYAEHDRKAAYLRDKIDPVADNPIYTPYSTYWEINPSSLTSVKLEYIGTLPQTTWNYITVNSREVYTSTGSVHPLWKDTEIMAIVGRMLRLTGVNIKDQELIQYANEIKVTGE